MKTFGRTIKEARELKGLTQSDVAKKVGVETATVSRWENDKQKNLKASHLEKLSNTLGLDSVELMKLDANRPEPAITFDTDNNLYKAFEVAEDLTDDQIDRLRRYLDFLQYSSEI